MWPAAAGDLLVFLFGMAAWVCWVRWLQGGNWKWYAGAIVSFVLAAFSKEAVWIFPVLMLLPVALNRTFWNAVSRARFHSSQSRGVCNLDLGDARGRPELPRHAFFSDRTMAACPDQ